jgi:hypothetical protein
LRHILLHHGEKRSEVYRRLFQVLWFGNSVGKKDSNPTAVPTYVFPGDIRMVVRQRFPEANAGQHDAAFSASSADVYTVTWNDFAAATWPKPPKACKLCNTIAKKPY